MCKHFDCVFYSPTTETCDYMIIMGKPRGCSPTDDCERFATNFNGLRSIIAGYRPRRVNMVTMHKLKKAYTPDMSSEELAKKAGVPINFASNWIKKTHPENVWLMRAGAQNG